MHFDDKTNLLSLTVEGNLNDDGFTSLYDELYTCISKINMSTYRVFIDISRLKISFWQFPYMLRLQELYRKSSASKIAILMDAASANGLSIRPGYINESKKEAIFFDKAEAEKFINR